MGKFVKIIIAFFIFISTSNIVNAEEWYIERLLQINSWVEAFDIELTSLDTYYFRDEALRNTYLEFVKVSSLLKKEIIKKYENSELEYYQTKWIITNYKNFIYYTNQIFYFLKLREDWYNWKELDTAVLETYQNIRTYYKRLKNLIYK